MKQISNYLILLLVFIISQLIPEMTMSEEQSYQALSETKVKMSIIKGNNDFAIETIQYKGLARIDTYPEGFITIIETRKNLEEILLKAKYLTPTIDFKNYFVLFSTGSNSQSRHLSVVKLELNSQNKLINISQNDVLVAGAEKEGKIPFVLVIIPVANKFFF